MQDLNDKLTGQTLSADEWNQQPSELQNVIEQLGQVLNGADLNQVGKAIAGYVANGTFYTDAGAANAYVLSGVGSKQTLPSLTNGTDIFFFPINNNTGPSVVNVAGIGNVNYKDEDGSDSPADMLKVGKLAWGKYNSSSGEFRRQPLLSNDLIVELKSGRRNLFVNGDFLINQSGFSFAPDGVTLAAPIRTSDQWSYTTILDGGNLPDGDVQVVPFPLGQTVVPNNPRNMLEMGGNIVGVTADSETIQMTNRIPDVSQLSGQICTWSFWVKGTVADDISLSMSQNFDSANGGSPSVSVFHENISIVAPNVWQKFTKTFLMPSISPATLGSAGLDHIAIGLVRQLGSVRAAGRGVAAVNYTGTLTFSDVQLEGGSFATKFDRLSFDEAERRAKYLFQRITFGSGEAVGTFTWNAGGSDRTLAQYFLPVGMRSTASISASSQGGAQTGNIINTGNGSISIASSNVLRAMQGNASHDMLLFWRDGDNQEGQGDSAHMSLDGGGLWILNLEAWLF
jgi:hypothetical protein